MAIAQHRSLQERIIAATKCIQGLKLSLPTLIDDMGGTYLNKYGGFPAGTVLVDTAGKVVFHSRGPRGCRPRDVERLFRQHLAEGGWLAPIEAAKDKEGRDQGATSRPAGPSRATSRPAE